MRIRPLLPLLLSSVALPVAAGDYSAVCLSAVDGLGCMIEQSEFHRQRNAEIEASIARVDQARAREYAHAVTHCKSRFTRTPRCAAERAQRFAAHQNALIEASIARVNEVRASEAARRAEADAAAAAVAAIRTRELEKSQNALSAASMAAAEKDRQRRFAARQNELATASIVRVEMERRRQIAIRNAPCTSPTDPRQRCEAERQRAFAAQQNALATASVERVAAERERAFAAARNAEANASIAAVERYRATARIETASIATVSAEEYAALTSHCVRAPQSPRCEAERIREFAAARNAEIERSLAAVARNRSATVSADEYAALTSHCVRAPQSPRCEAERIREFALNDCRSVGYSSSACDYARPRDVIAAAPTAEAEYAALTSHCVRAPQSPRCEAERIREFAAARNAEINRSIAAVAAARAQRAATASQPEPSVTGVSPLETGAIRVPTLPRIDEQQHETRSPLQHSISADPCRGKPFEALQFTRGAKLENSMIPELDRLAETAQSCPGMRIEVHAYADGGSAFNNRNLSQARAQAIADYLIANGVSPYRVAAMGRGGSRPVLPYSEGYDPAFGGRAEFVIRDPGTDAAVRRVMWDLAELLDPTYIPAVANLSP